MIALVAQSCRSCRRPWCSTPEAVERWRSCPFCGAASIQTGDPPLVCLGCHETLREAAPDWLCGWCVEQLAAA